MMLYSKVVVTVQEKARYINTGSFLSLMCSTRWGSQQNISILTKGTENKREVIISQWKPDKSFYKLRNHQAYKQFQFMI